jgi:hypothetical protein
MIKIITKNEGFEFDLTGDEQIAITIQQPTPDKIDTFQSDYSTTFRIPATQKNMNFLENLDFPLSISDFGYKYLAVRIFSNNIEIYPDARF